MAKNHTIVVRAQWDSEAEVWVATSADVPGLVTEAESQRALMAKIETMIPELLEDEGPEGLAEVPVLLMTEQLTKVRLNAA